MAQTPTPTKFSQSIPMKEIKDSCQEDMSCPAGTQLVKMFQQMLEAEIGSLIRSVQNCSNKLDGVCDQVSNVKETLEGPEGLVTKIAVIEAVKKSEIRTSGSNSSYLFGLFSIIVAIVAVFVTILKH